MADGLGALKGGASYNTVIYEDPQQGNILKSANNTGGVGTGSVKGAGTVSGGTSPVNSNTLMLDIAQSHHFTVQLDGFTMYTTPAGTFSKFLPVKSLNYTYTSYENMSVPLAIFGDFPLLNRKRVSTLSLTCFDTDDNKLEHELRNWENMCFPNGRFVAYMEDIVRKFVYRGYNVKGKETYNASFFVMPSGNIATSRDYSANDAKLINFNLVCVGDGETCSTGISRKVQPVQGYEFYSGI